MTDWSWNTELCVCLPESIPFMKGSEVVDGFNMFLLKFSYDYTEFCSW